VVRIGVHAIQSQYHSYKSMFDFRQIQISFTVTLSYLSNSWAYCTLVKGNERTNDLHELVAACRVRTRWNSAKHVEYLGCASAADESIGMSQDDVETDTKYNGAAFGEQTVPDTQHRLSTYTQTQRATWPNKVPVGVLPYHLVWKNQNGVATREEKVWRCLAISTEY